MNDVLTIVVAGVAGLQLVAVQASTGNDINGQLFSTFFSFFLSCFPSLLSMFVMEQLLESNIFFRKLVPAPKPEE